MRSFRLIGALLTWGAFCFAQAQILTPRLYVYYKLPADPAWRWESIVIDPSLTLSRDAAGQAHLTPATTPPSTGGLMLVDANGVPQGGPISTLILGTGSTWVVSGNTLQISPDSNVIPSKINLQGAGNPQNCISSSGSTANYQATCNPGVTKMEKYQILNWFVDVANTGPATLSVDTFPALPTVRVVGSNGEQSFVAMKVLDRNGNELAAGQLTIGPYRIWNDGTNWRVLDLLPSAAPAPASPPAVKP